MKKRLSVDVEECPELNRFMPGAMLFMRQAGVELRNGTLVDVSDAPNEVDALLNAVDPENHPAQEIHDLRDKLHTERLRVEVELENVADRDRLLKLARPFLVDYDSFLERFTMGLVKEHGIKKTAEMRALVKTLIDSIGELET